MSLGMILLVALSLLILFGAMQRVLDRMGLTDRQALACAAAIFIGGWLPDIPFGRFTINPGGALIPLFVCAYLILRAGTNKERMRCLIASALSAASIYAVSVFFPADPESMPFDPMILYGAFSGLIAWFLGRSRRSAFVAGILGVILADSVVGFINWQSGISQVVHLGGAGALDAVVFSGLSAVLICELFGEILERIKTGKADASNEDGAIEGGIRA